LGVNSKTLSEIKAIETTLIGTGGGYGESIVIHLGNNDWIVIDSCINPKTKKSLPLEYLESLNVNLSIDLKLIVCTHWHDDHILGISQLLEVSNNAIFCLAVAKDRNKFLKFVGLDNNKIKNESTASSAKEISNCLEILKLRKTTVKQAVEDKILLSHKENGFHYEVISLSPSDYVIEEYNNEISTLITEYGNSNKKVVYQKPNDKSVVILIKINNHRILLGSDLEVTSDRRKGWFCILDNSQTIDRKSDVFKIPHHGSENGYHKDIWEKLVAKNAIAKLTPWNKGEKLPNKEMLSLFLNHTNNLYTTSVTQTSKGKQKKRDKGITKAINRFNPTLKEVKFSKGIVQCRCDLECSDWSVELIESAKKINTDDFCNM